MTTADGRDARAEGLDTRAEGLDARAEGARALPDGRSTRWVEHRAARRRELVEAALRAIREHGASVGMDEVAAAAGTSKTVFYRHFADRAGLFHAVAERVDALILRDVGNALGESGVPLAEVGANPQSLIGAAIDAYLTLVEKDPEVYRFIVAAPLLGHTGPPGDPAARMSGHVAEQMAGLLRQALRTAGHEDSAAAVWGHGVVGMVRAAADAWLAQEPGFAGMPRHELARHLTTFAWSGLSTAWPGAATGSQRRRGPVLAQVSAPEPRQ